MADYTYTGNKDPHDGTSIIVLRGGLLRLALGQWADLTNEEWAQLQARFILVEGQSAELATDGILGVAGAAYLISFESTGATAADNVQDAIEEVAAEAGLASEIVNAGNLGSSETFMVEDTIEYILLGTMDSADCAITLSGGLAGTRGRLELTQDATGGRTADVTVDAQTVSLPVDADPNSVSVFEFYFTANDTARIVY